MTDGYLEWPSYVFDGKDVFLLDEFEGDGVKCHEVLAPSRAEALRTFQRGFKDDLALCRVMGFTEAGREYKQMLEQINSLLGEEDG